MTLRYVSNSGGSATTSPKGYHTDGDFTSFVEQNPTGIDTPTTVTFGAGGTSNSGEITIGSDGVLTVNTTNYFGFKTRYRCGREGASGVSEIFVWVEQSLDGGNTWSVLGNSIDISLRDSNEIDIFFDFTPVILPAGYKLRSRFARSSTGTNFGGLLQGEVSAPLAALGVPDAPSAQITVYRLDI